MKFRSVFHRRLKKSNEVLSKYPQSMKHKIKIDNQQFANEKKSTTSQKCSCI